MRLSAHGGLAFTLLVAAVGGIVLSFAFPPASVWPLAVPGVGLWLWVLRRSGPGRGFISGLVFGLAFYGVTLWWIFRFGVGAWTALVLMSALFAAVIGLVAAAIRRPGRPWVSALAMAGLWTATDWLRGLVPFGGFTWGSVGISQVGNPVTLRLATITGVWGVTFVVVLAAALVVEAIAGGGALARRWLLVGAGLAALLAPVAIPFASASGHRVRIATVQVDVREAAGATSALDEDLGVARLNADAHRSLAADPPDLAVWGEGALDPGATSDPETMDRVRSAIASVGAPTLVGAVVDDPDGRERTTVLLFDKSARLVGRYDKVHLVPFGEYVPFRRRLSWFGALQQIPVDRAPGHSVKTLTTGGLPPFAAPICFENSFPAIPRAMVRDGATFLVVTVNNASYGFSPASAQHLQMSQMRAVETGRWIVNAAVSGISAFIDPSGRIVSHTKLFEPAILRGTVVSSTSRTWYVRLGDWLPWLCLLGVLVLVLARPRRRDRRPAPGPLRPDWRALVILPTYDELKTIEPVLRGVLMHERVDALVIDDGSPDGTGAVVRAIAETEPRVRLVERPVKAGLASAYLAGFRIALDEGYDLVGEMDADRSHDPVDLAAMLSAAGSADLVLGSRYVAGGSVADWSAARVLLSRTANAYARLMLGMSVRDATSGFRVYRRDLLEAILAEPVVAHGYGFQIELALRAWRGGWRVHEHPIAFRDREHGKSKISRTIVVEALWHVTKWGLAARFHRGSFAARSEGS